MGRLSLQIRSDPGDGGRILQHRQGTIRDQHGICLGRYRAIRYFLSQTEKAFATVKRPQELTSLNTNQMRLYNSLPEAFVTKEAKDIADKLRYPERSLFRFLNESNLFKKTDHGSYEKKAL
jgi:hypothetical protein